MDNKEDLDRFHADQVSRITRLDRELHDIKSSIDAEDLDIDGTVYLFSSLFSSMNNLKVKLANAIEIAKEEVDKREKEDEVKSGK